MIATARLAAYEYNAAASQADPVQIGGIVDLSLQTRAVGRVTIVRCSGRIVAGAGSVALREHVSELLLDRRSIVLHLGEVTFIDSSGLGTMVRTLNITRKAHGELKLCNVPEHSLPGFECRRAGHVARGAAARGL